MSEIILHVNDVVGPDAAALVILHPTGIKYSAQTGGIACNHPVAEGFTIAMYEFTFDDCKYGCSHIQDAPEAQEKLAKDLDEFLIKESATNIIKLSFDFSRIRELQEGWWPVIINGNLSGLVRSNSVVDMKGFIHNGNCD